MLAHIIGQLLFKAGMGLPTVLNVVVATKVDLIIECQVILRGISLLSSLLKDKF